MKALVLEDAGALRAATLELPDPVGDQVRVRLSASGVLPPNSAKGSSAAPS